MNSVISAFKTKKISNNGSNINGAVEKQNVSSSGLGSHVTITKKKTPAATSINAQDNGYQYLRHIREIETANKLLSPVVVAADDLLESEKLNFRPPAPPLPNSPMPGAAAGVDAVDHCSPATVRLVQESCTDFNMNGKANLSPGGVAAGGCGQQAAIDNGNMDLYDLQLPQTNGYASPTLPEADDDEVSEHSTAACTSSSSEHSNSTVVHSPTVVVTTTATTTASAAAKPAAAIKTNQQQQQQQQQPSPAKSLNLSLSSNSPAPNAASNALNASASASTTSSSSSLSCSMAISCEPHSTSTTTLSSLCSSGSFNDPSPTTMQPLTVSTLADCNDGDGIGDGDDDADGCINSPTALNSPTSICNGHDDYVPAFLRSQPITLPIIMPNGNSGLSTATTPGNSAANTPKHARYTKPRLSLSRFINHSMPSVHGRPNLSVAPNGTAAIAGMGAGVGPHANGANPPKRISTHQRNMSLDFRSMGIFLPPVSQVTNTRVSQHHRNRSLDSALQRIPEVEVSSPNAESENTFCSPSILGTNMCSKIVTTAASVTAALSTTPTPALTAATTKEQETAPNAITFAAVGYITPTTPVTTTAAVHQQHHHQHPPYHQHQTQPTPSAIVEASPMLRMRPKSSEASPRVVQDISSLTGINGINGCPTSTNSCSSAGSSKKREDLTSLGSDDSGIICGSESDQISLNRIRHSHESLDSEMDAEEECIDMLETTSMDEEYNLLQSDLCFYPQTTAETDCRTLRPPRKQRQLQQQQQKLDKKDNPPGESIDDRIRYRVMNMSQAAINVERATVPNEREVILDNNKDVDQNDEHADANHEQEEGEDVVDATRTPTNATPINVNTVTAAPTTPSQPTTTQTATPTTETTKNDQVLFKNFFGATKNAIFRTAQSIIENHEKKNAAKQRNDQETATATNINANTIINATTQEQVKSPSDISKKKEFFSLLTSNSSKKAAAAAAAAAAASANASAASTPAATPTVESANMEFKAEDDARHGYNDCNQRTLNLRLPGAVADDPSSEYMAANTALSKSSSINSLNKLKVPGVVKYFINDRTLVGDVQLLQQEHQKTEKGSSGLLRFFESPVFNIHFAVHYLFYSKEPGVLSFIGNKIFSFPDQEVDLYIPQLIIMYIQMDELAEVLDPYLTIRCRKSVDFSLKCLWLLEAYNYQVDTLSMSSARKSKLALMKEIFSKKETKMLTKNEINEVPAVAILKKTHHRSQSDATVLVTDSHSTHSLSISNRLYQPPPYTTLTLPTYNATPAKLCLGDLTSGRAFDNGCTCFESVRGQVNGLLGHKTFCSCGAPKTSPQKEFMKALINVGKNLTSLPSKAEKTSALRMFLNLINKNLPARVWLPLYSDIPHHVVRITEEKTAVLNSKDKTPYIIYVEVVEVPDIYSSPVIPKMMPSLRHTKSVEHLEGMPACGGHSQPQISCTHTSTCSNQQGNNPSCHRKKEKPASDSLSVASTDAQGQHMNGNNGLLGGGACGDVTHNYCAANLLSMGGLQLNEDDVWSQEDDEITAQYMNLRKISERDAISQMSLDSCDSRDQGPPVVFNIGDVRTRHCKNLSCENTKSFSNDPEDPSAAALKEPWHEKEQQIRESSPYGHLSNWRLLSAIVKCGDDLRQELMATQLLQMFKIIWQEEHVDLWVRPYKIVCLSNDSGLIEPILNTVSLHQIKKNSNKSLRDYFLDEYGSVNGENFKRAQINFVQSCAAYCLISYLLQVKDRHNGNILLHSDGHIIHIDFGFILSISPKNLGFEQSPFKLTPEFVDVMGGTNSEHWREFNRLLLVGMMSARKHMDRIINFVEIMRSNAQLPCFKNGCSGSVQNLRKRFHMNLTEQEMERKVEQLVQDSLKSLSTKLYDGYQYYTNGIL